MSSGEKLLPDSRNSMDRIAAGAAVISEAATLSPRNVACQRVQTDTQMSIYYLILGQPSDYLILISESVSREY